MSIQTGYCSDCGTRNPKTEDYCMTCGKRLAWADDRSPPASKTRGGLSGTQLVVTVIIVAIIAVACGLALKKLANQPFKAGNEYYKRALPDEGFE